MELKFENTYRERIPGLAVALIKADIVNGPTDDALWDRIQTVAARIRDSYQMPDVNKHPAIAATRAAYKTLGKEPNRYRPSAEALMRRAVKGLELYRTTAMVDLINLVSMATGHSIGAFDADHIDGDTLTLGVGREGEPYEAIGRGQLNIACLPVWRDRIGGVGTPTSDNDRTKLSPSTRRVVITVNLYGDTPGADETVEMIADLMTRHVSATNITSQIYRP